MTTDIDTEYVYRRQIFVTMFQFKPEIEILREENDNSIQLTAGWEEDTTQKMRFL